MISVRSFLNTIGSQTLKKSLNIKLFRDTLEIVDSSFNGRQVCELLLGELNFRILRVPQKKFCIQGLLKNAIELKKKQLLFFWKRKKDKVNSYSSFNFQLPTSNFAIKVLIAEEGVRLQTFLTSYKDLLIFFTTFSPTEFTSKEFSS